MAATELLDYNQIQEQTAATGDLPPEAGGPMIWQFRADPNLAWDPSQTWFAMDVKVQTYGSVAGSTIAATSSLMGKLALDALDIRPFFPLRCFNSMSHTIDGVTVASTQRPYCDKILQERYLHESTQSNLSNFEALQTTRCIDSGDPADNIFLAGQKDTTTKRSSYEAANFQHLYNSTRPNRGNLSVEQENDQYVTVLFQPPFDFWTKHQRCSGGNHQITLNLKPKAAYTTASEAATHAMTASEAGWGSYIVTDCVGQVSRSVFAANGDMAIAGSGLFMSVGANVSTEAIGTNAAAATLHQTLALAMDIKRIRLLRRMVRFTIERPIATQEFNLTEFQLYVGQPGETGCSQNFLLPSSTFGLVFWFKDANNTEHDVLGDFPKMQAHADQKNSSDCSTFLNLDQFYFTYGGETYPAQRIEKISTYDASNPMGYQKLQTISNQLMGVYNMPQEYINTSFTKGGLMTRLDAQQFFFPVAKHANSDNSDLQVTYTCTIAQRAASGINKAFNSGGHVKQASQVCLCVAALYDARVELAYNAANQLEKVTKTEWK